jgi:hypothetical protein
VCTGGQCTWVDADIAVPMTLHAIGSFHNFEINNLILEDYLQSAYAVIAGHVANYEIRGVTVTGPDNLPIAAAGVGNHGANDFRSDVTARYDPSCGTPGGNTPDTTNQSGVPACSGPVWVANCDFTSGEIEMKDSSGPPSVVGRFANVVGASSQCSTAPYEIETVVRTTAAVCSGAPCTLVDTPVVVSMGPVDGAIFQTVALTAGDFGTLSESVEVRDAFVRDPLGADLASVGVTNAFETNDPAVRFAFRDLLNPSDDKVTLRGKFGHPPLDPSVGGATFTVTDRNGTIYSVTIPASSWIVKSPGAKWLYKDQLGTIGGVRRASITQIDQGGGFKFSVKAKDVTLGATNLPSVNLVLDASDGGSGRTIAMQNATCKSKTKSKSCRL